ncbi:MAG: formylmethanofuran dehydrogenase subunit C [Gammaproteobacteria bacterium]
MSITLTLLTEPQVPLEAEVISTDRLRGLSEPDIAALLVHHGNEPRALGDFFRVSGRYDGEVRVEGDLARVKRLGTGMSEGRLLIDGNAGMHLGTGMSGGEIVVRGNAGDWVGPDLSGGRIVIHGNAGHMAGSAHRGNRVGIQGGEIIVHGNAGNEAGNAMRNGLIAVGGNCGDFTGVNMLAGTIVALGELGWRCGAAMKRGTIVTMKPAQMLPTFSRACVYQPAFLRLYLLHLRALGLPITEDQLNGRYERWSGDAVEMNRGEILMLIA